MATSSNIGLLNKNGSVTYVYCHSDGYPEGVGSTLAQHWTDPSKIAQLMELGDIAILGTELRSPENENDRRGTYAYHREFDADIWWRNRGGSFKPGTLEAVPPLPPYPGQATDKDEYVRHTREGGCDYAYLLTRDGWEIYAVHGDTRYRPLKQVLGR